MLVVGTILYALELFLFEKASFSQSIRSYISTAFRLGVSHCSFGEIALELHHPGKLLFGRIQGVDTRFKQSKTMGASIRWIAKCVYILLLGLLKPCNVGSVQTQRDPLPMGF